MTTVRELIDNLFKVEDLDQPVIYEYYTKDHFMHTGVSDENWAKIVDEFDSILTDDNKYSEVERAARSAK